MEKLKITKDKIAQKYGFEAWDLFEFSLTPVLNIEALIDETITEYSSELLRQNSEMKEAVKEILNKATIQHTTIRDLLMHPETTDENQINKLQAMDRVLNNFKCDLADCLTSCNKGKE